MTTTTTTLRTLLGIDESDHNNLIIDAGVDYIGRQCAWSLSGREKLLKSRAFWHWWWRNWLSVDAALEAGELTHLAVNEYLRAHLMAHAFELPRVMWKHIDVSMRGTEVTVRQVRLKKAA